MYKIVLLLPKLASSSGLVGRHSEAPQKGHGKCPCKGLTLVDKYHRPSWPFSSCPPWNIHHVLIVILLPGKATFLGTLTEELAPAASCLSELRFTICLSLLWNPLSIGRKGTTLGPAHWDCTSLKEQATQAFTKSSTSGDKSTVTICQSW